MRRVLWETPLATIVARLWTTAAETAKGVWPPRLFDCFTFYDELDLLELRLAELGDIVARFVLVEAASTFQGQPKPLVFEKEKARFAPWLDKIEHVVIDFPDPIQR